MYCNMKLAVKSVASYKQEFSLAEYDYFFSVAYLIESQ